MEPTGPPSEAPPPPPSSDARSITLTRGQVVRIHSRRMQYMLLYLVPFVIFCVVQLGSAPSINTLRVLGTVSVVFLAAFYVRFWQVLTAMAYPVPMRLVACAAVFLPIPGLLFLAYIDRTIAKALRKGEERARGG